MAHIHDAPAALTALPDDLHRERILRARKMSGEQWVDALGLTTGVFARMDEGATRQLGTTDAELGRQEVRRRRARLDRAHDERRFVNTKPGPQWPSKNLLRRFDQ